MVFNTNQFRDRLEVHFGVLFLQLWEGLFVEHLIHRHFAELCHLLWSGLCGRLFLARFQGLRFHWAFRIHVVALGQPCASFCSWNDDLILRSRTGG